MNESNREIVQCERCNRYLTIESMVEERLRKTKGLHVDPDEDDFPEESSQERLVGLNGLAVLW